MLEVTLAIIRLLSELLLILKADESDISIS
jgi:hypothetical protein